METTENKPTTRKVYRAAKAQRIQIDGKLVWHAVGVEVDPKNIHPMQIVRMVRTRFLIESDEPITVEVAAPVPAKAAVAKPIPPVAAEKTPKT